MKTWRDVIVLPTETIRSVPIKFHAGGARVALVADENQMLLGTVRTVIFGALKASDEVRVCVNTTPQTAHSQTDSQHLVSLMRRKRLRQIPLVDDAGKLVGLKMLDEFVLTESRENWIVLTAGGLGTRPSGLTKTVPKPMRKVGDRSLLETIIDTFVDQRFCNIYLPVEIIERYFHDDEAFGANRYIRETKRLGTADSLSLLPSTPSEPLIVANGDLLARVDYLHMLDCHIDSGAAATVGTSEYEFQIPDGVVLHKDNRIVGMEEKPIHKSLMSAGVNVLSSEVLPRSPKNTFFDTLSHFTSLVNDVAHVVTYQIHGYSVDIGRIPDYEMANAEIDTATRQTSNIEANTNER
jgi:dTDP-glucose pyrophosphorylase